MSEKKCGTCDYFVRDPKRPYSGMCVYFDGRTNKGPHNNGLDSDRYFRVRDDAEPSTRLCWHELTDSVEQVAIDAVKLIFDPPNYSRYKLMREAAEGYAERLHALGVDV